MRKFLSICCLTIISAMLLPGCKNEYKLFVGGFTEQTDLGLSIYDFNSRNGKLKLISRHDVGGNPSYFSYDENKKLFYSLNEVMQFNGTFGGGLTTFKYDEEIDSMTMLNELRIPHGGPCFISMSPDSSYLFIANYPNGSVAVVKLNEFGIPETITDTILYNKKAPDESNAHMIVSDPSGRRIYVTDLGMDMIRIYDFDTEKGKLNLVGNGEVSVEPKSGPRHFVFNKDGTKMYVIFELGQKVMVFDVNDADGLKLLQTLPTTRADFEGNNYCADIHMSNDGKFIYGSNRGENTIVTFSIGSDGLLTLVGHTTCGGNWPRNFTLDPSGKFMLVGNQKSDSIAVFRMNIKTGLPVEAPKYYDSSMPACLKFYK